MIASKNISLIWKISHLVQSLVVIDMLSMYERFDRAFWNLVDQRRQERKVSQMSEAEREYLYRTGQLDELEEYFYRLDHGLIGGD